VTVAANRTPVLNHHGKHNPTAEVTDLLELEAQFLVGPEPVLKEATDRRSTLEVVSPPVQDHIFGDAAHHPVEITAIQSLKLLAHKLNRIGRRELLAHLPASIPDGQQAVRDYRRCHRIEPCRSLSRNLREDLEDVGSNFDGAPDLEFRLATDALELEKSGLSFQSVPPDYRFPYGHTHKEQEEVYVVVRGSGRMKLDDEIVEVKEWDVVRVPPGTWRGYEGGPEGLEILVFGAPNLGENPREDVEGQRDWWAD
jgi:mannose-6-phosphate isomerase-like protein (cupin superfamily)